MNENKFKELLEQAREAGANEDYPHEVLAQTAQEYTESVELPDDITDSQREAVIDAYIQGFCQAEGYGNK